MLECAESRLCNVTPADFQVHELLGKGANNKVYRVTWDGHSRVLRAPRRKSDTQHATSCRWELAHSRMAASLGVGPEVVAAWRTRHRDGAWSSGLYMVMEHFPLDLERLMTDEKHCEMAMRHRDEIGTEIARALASLARAGMLLYDLKPSNIVVSLPAGGPLRARVIDYGRDFCEWRCPDAGVTCAARTPTLDLIDALAKGDGDLAQHLRFACMVAQLASTTTRMLYQDRHDTRMSVDERAKTNPMLPWSATFLNGMQGRNVSLLRHILRSEDVKGVLQHYQGRRYAGTRRTLKYAKEQS